MEAKDVQKMCFEQLLRSYDPEMGGFSKAPKFPQPVNFNFLFHYYSLKPQEDRAKQGLKMVLHTLDMMAKGGIHDHISQVSYYRVNNMDWPYSKHLLHYGQEKQL